MNKFLIAVCLISLQITIFTATANAATYNDGDACAEAGAMHRKNNANGFHYLICDGTSLLWKEIVTYEDDNQYVGIGTNSPTVPLDITGAEAQGDYIVRIENTTVHGELLEMINSNGVSIYQFAVGGGSGTQPYMTMNNYNGTSSLSFNNENNTWKIDANGAPFYLHAPASGRDQLYLDTTGYVGIRTDAPQAELHVIGDIQFTGTITDVSDERFKTKIKPIENALDGIRNLTGVSFVMIDDPKNIVELGLIAQDVKRVFPDLVRQQSEGTLSLNYLGMVGPIVEAIKELDQKNKTQSEIISEQRVMINSLSKRMDILEGKIRPPLKPYNH